MDAITKERRLEPSKLTYSGIFTLSAAILLFELSLTRIFSVILWSNLAFMVVSTALFGFALSGIFIGLSPANRKISLASVALNCFWTGLAMLLAYLVVTHVPFQMWQFRKNPLNYLTLAVWEIALLLPFFFGGLAIARLLSLYPLKSGKLYGFDLIGAAVGSLALVPLLPLLNGEGVVLVSALFACLAALFLSELTQGRLKIAAVLTIIALLIVAPNAERWLPIKFFQEKRRFNEAVSKHRITDTRWSTISRVDIAPYKPKSGPLKGQKMRAVWIDAGTNASVVLPWDGNLSALKPITWSTIAAVDALKSGTNPKVLIIGSSGGREVLMALSHGARHVDAVEMDPSIVHFLHGDSLKKFSGNLFENERVTLINDEGRAFTKRQAAGSYDIIQSVNNYTPVAMAAGALNLSETFLLTKEAIKDYYERLSSNGVLALYRGATLRMALTAIAALREMGIDHPA